MFYLKFSTDKKVKTRDDLVAQMLKLFYQILNVSGFPWTSPVIINATDKIIFTQMLTMTVFGLGENEPRNKIRKVF